MPTCEPSAIPTATDGRHLFPGEPSSALIRVHVTDVHGLRSALERAPGVEERVEQEVIVDVDVVVLHQPLVVPAGRRVKLVGADYRVKFVAEDSGIIEVHSGASITIEGIKLVGGTRDRGGAIHNDHGAVALSNCSLVNNSAVFHGGAVFSAGGEVVLENVTLVGNSAGEAGGGLFIVDDAFASIQAIDFQGNYAPRGSDLILGAAAPLAMPWAPSSHGPVGWRVMLWYLVWALAFLAALVALPWVTWPGTMAAATLRGQWSWMQQKPASPAPWSKAQWEWGPPRAATAPTGPGATGSQQQQQRRLQDEESLSIHDGDQPRQLLWRDREDEGGDESPLPTPRGPTRSFDHVGHVDVVIAAERSAILNADSADAAPPRSWWRSWLSEEEEEMDEDDQGEEKGVSYEEAGGEGAAGWEGPGSGARHGPGDSREPDAQFLLRNALVDLQHLRLTGSVAHGAHASVFKATYSGEAPPSPPSTPTRSSGAGARRLAAVRRWDETGHGLAAVLPRHRPLAVKRLKLEEEPEVVVARWRNEAEIWLRVSHPNVVALRGVLCEATLFESPQGLSTFGFGLVLDWHPYSLRDTLVGVRNDRHRRRRGTAAGLTPLRLRVARDVARGLTYLHELRIMHRDVKASNIMLARGGDAQISDFGEASAELPRSGHNHPTQPAARGTLLYAAPEVLRGEAHGPAVDIWSLGMVMVELMANRPLYDLWKEQSALNQSSANSPGPVPLDAAEACGWRPSLEPWGHTVLARLVDRCLAQSSAARPSMRAVLAGIEEELCRLAAQGLSSTSLPPPGRNPPATQASHSPSPQPSPTPGRSTRPQPSLATTANTRIVTRQPHPSSKDPPYSGAEKLWPSHQGRPVESASSAPQSMPTTSASPEQQAMSKSFYQRWGHHFKTPPGSGVPRKTLPNTSTRTNPAIVDQEPFSILPLDLEDQLSHFPTEMMSQGGQQHQVVEERSQEQQKAHYDDHQQQRNVQRQWEATVAMV